MWCPTEVGRSCQIQSGHMRKRCDLKCLKFPPRLRTAVTFSFTLLQAGCSTIISIWRDVNQWDLFTTRSKGHHRGDQKELFFYIYSLTRQTIVRINACGQNVNWCSSQRPSIINVFLERILDFNGLLESVHSSLKTLRQTATADLRPNWLSTPQLVDTILQTAGPKYTKYWF